MRVQLLGICVAMVFVSICGAGNTAPSNVKPKPTPMKVLRTAAPANPALKAPGVTQPTLSGSMPSAAIPAAPNKAETQPSAGGIGAGPSATATQATANKAVMEGATAMTTDANYVYVMHGGMLYKFAKSDVSVCGTPFPPAEPCPPCNPCGTISYIPGYTGSCISTTTCTPCPVGSGPSQTTIQCLPGPVQPCPSPCPTHSPGPCPVPCPPAQPSSCDPCAPPCPQPTAYCTTVVSAATGAGPCAACPPVATVTACGQATVNCLQTLCGAEADKAYLQALIMLNMQVLALSDASAQYLGTTSLQNYATNSIADSKTRIHKSERWLKSKFCLAVTACPPSLSPGFDICDIRALGREFDESYKSQLVQFYVDEIAISQVVLERGLDCQVKELAAQVIRDNQARIERMKRCGICRV